MTRFAPLSPLAFLPLVKRSSQESAGHRRPVPNLHVRQDKAHLWSRLCPCLHILFSEGKNGWEDFLGNPLIFHHCLRGNHERG